VIELYTHGDKDTNPYLISRDSDLYKKSWWHNFWKATGGTAHVVQDRLLTEYKCYSESRNPLGSGYILIFEREEDATAFVLLWG